MYFILSSNSCFVIFAQLSGRAFFYNDEILWVNKVYYYYYYYYY